MEEIQEKKREPRPAPKPESTKHLRVLANGAVYDTIKGRIVSSKNVTTKITPARSIELQSRRQELKRERLMAAANAVAAQGGGVDGRELTGDLAFVEAIGEAMTMKALTVNDPKAVDAARFIFQETGLSVSQDSGDPARSNVGAPRIYLLLAQLHERQDDVIDGQVTGRDIPIIDNVRIDEQDSGSPTDQDGGE